MSLLYDKLKQGLHEADVHLAGESTGGRVHIPHQIDVKRIRAKLDMTQAAFASRFGFSVDAVRHWEAGRRVPEASARAYLTVIDLNPRAVSEALATGRSRHTDASRPRAAAVSGQRRAAK